VNKLLVLLLVTFPAFAQVPNSPGNFKIGLQPVEQPYFEFVWNEGDGTVPIPTGDMEHYGQTVGRVEIDFTPRLLPTTGVSQRILDIPNHLGMWVWNDGIHGDWYNNAGQRRVFRTRWGLPAIGEESKIVITWNAEGYAVIVDRVLRIHDWQTSPTTVFPDPDAVSGVYGSRVNGSLPTTGAFKVRVYDKAKAYNPCIVDVVGTINQGVPLDNTGAWTEGIDPVCFVGSVTLSWTNPTQNEDGTSLTDLASVTIFESSSAIQIKTFTAGETTIVIENLSSGEHCYYAKATNSAGISSVASNIACKTVN